MAAANAFRIWLAVMATIREDSKAIVGRMILAIRVLVADSQGKSVFAGGSKLFYKMRPKLLKNTLGYACMFFVFFTLLCWGSSMVINTKYVFKI